MKITHLTLIELLMVQKSETQVFSVLPSQRTAVPGGRAASAPQPIPAHGNTREGFGGEKAARKSASLPVPTNHQPTNRPIIATQQSLRSASGEVEQKRGEIFPQKSGKIASRFCGSFSPRRPTAAESDSAPYAAPAPCRTQGVRGAADTPPASHGHATLTREAPFRTPGVRGAADTPLPPTATQRSPARHLAGRRGCGGRRIRSLPPTATQRSPTRHLAGRRGCGGRRTRPLPPTATQREKRHLRSSNSLW